MEYASKGVAGAALGTGIGGLALGVLNGGLGNILGGLGGCNNGWNNGCHENMPVNRYELGLQQEVAANATFYPKMVADVTTGTTTTAQMLYNPLPSCGCCK